eukprot:CAMPEP_0117749566 /NCGR_PEP_ID=MMETSP0947-20121206/9808_1 /TAXON_ID=44440 /ORGANISM="Chattonella subsalsa, Strain CCMP2191" /LENGTH=305 /DNA_ID=CAMNT_0005567485 /DNA_START=96 /DNA_END=1016 /DNA_ORIENTATION=+
MLQGQKTLTTGIRTDLEVVLEVAETAAKEAGKIIQDNMGASVKNEKSNHRDLVTKYDGMCEKIIVELINERFPHHIILGEESVAAGTHASVLALSEKLRDLDNYSSEEDDEPMLWVIDPIDGTTNFAMGLPLAVVSIGIYYKGQAVVGTIYHPALDECFTAIRGQGAKLNGERIQVRDDAELKDAVINCGFCPNPRALEVCARGMEALRHEVRGLRMFASAALVMSWIASGRLSGYFSYDLNAWDLAAGSLILEEAGGKITDLDGTEYGLETRNMLASNGILHPVILKELRKANAISLDGGEWKF